MIITATETRETPEEVFEVIVAAFHTRDQSRSDAIRFVDSCRAPAVWKGIRDDELRGLAQRFNESAAWWASRR